jgi:hypothetical protein
MEHRPRAREAGKRVQVGAFDPHFFQGPEMRRGRIAVAGIVLAVFCLGVLVGRRAGRSRSPAASAAAPFSSAGGAAGCVDFHDAAPHAGQAGCVSGRVLKVFTSRGGNTFLDFCEDYRECPFSSVIFSSDRHKFGDLQSLAGEQIEIRGPITVYQGKPEIIVRDPEQIRRAR